MKKLILLLITQISIAQSNQISLMVGYKAIETSIAYTAPNEVIYGISLSIVDSKIAEDRANKKDLYHHDFNDKYIPSAFGLIGGKFDNLSVIGKLGTGYVNQHINNIQDNQKFYLAGGIILDYEISNSLSIRSSFDSVNSLLLGITFNL